MSSSFTNKEIEAFNGFVSKYTGSTLKMYTRDLNMLFLWLLEEKQIRMLKAKPIDLEHFGRYLEEVRKNKVSSVNRRLSTVKRFYTYAHAVGLIKMNPAIALRLPPVRNKDHERYGLNRLQMSILLNYAISKSPKDGALVALLMVMGLRVSTALSLNVEDTYRVENGHRVIRYETKFKTIGIKPIPVPVARVLDKLVEGRTTHRN